MNASEEKLFRKLLNSQADEVRNSTPLDPFARSSPVSPSSPKELMPANAGGIDTGTTLGRGNDPSRSSGPNIPPKQPGLELPMPPQSTGSNMPGSTIKQFPSVLDQEPGPQLPSNKPVVVVPSAHDMPHLVRTPSEAFLSENDEPWSPSGHGNPYGPVGRIGPRTAGGNDANPLSPGDNGVGAQLLQPMKVQQERAWTDKDRPPASRSPLIQNIPAQIQHASTILQTPISIPQGQPTKSPTDFNQPTPLQAKPEASDSPGVQKTFPPGWADANVPKKRVISQIIERDVGA